MKDKQIIEKQDELIRHQKKQPKWTDANNFKSWESKLIQLESELSSLKQGKGETCKCTYPRPSTYGGEGIRTCVDCNKYIESPPEKKPTDEVQTSIRGNILVDQSPQNDGEDKTNNK